MIPIPEPLCYLGRTNVSVKEAASLLNVSDRRVRHLVAKGELEASRLGERSLLISRDSIDRRRRIHHSVGRRLSERSCWAVIHLAMGDAIASPVERARARARLERLGALSPASLAARARVSRYRAHPGLLESLRADGRLALSGRDAVGEHGADIVLPDSISAYVRPADLQDLERDYLLQPSSEAEGNVILRVIPLGEPLPRQDSGVVPPVLLALDLIDDADERSVRVGRQLLQAVPMVEKHL